jgi:hypothetical protein
MMGPYLMDLPTELLKLIMTDLWWLGGNSGNIADFCALRLTCRRLQQAATPILYQSPDFQGVRQLKRFLQCTRDRQHLLALVKEVGPWIAIDDVSQIPLGLQQFPQLRSIFIRVAQQFGAAILAPRFDIFPALEECKYTKVIND